DADANRKWGRRVLLRLVAKDCGGYSIYGKDDHYFVETTPGCKEIKNNLAVSKIENIAIIDDGVNAYDAVYEKCKNEKMKIVIGGAAGSTTVACATLSRRAPYAVFQAPIRNDNATRREIMTNTLSNKQA
ncbi:MAG: hypothetical protein K8I82_13945, partial [Anaerolineae bacterium]|nr:hypothetical protein [Anaerolineae bacterium]